MTAQVGRHQVSAKRSRKANNMNRSMNEPVGRLRYTAQEVADMLGFECKTICRAMDEGEIPLIEMGRQRRIPDLALLHILEMEGGATLGK